MKRFPWFSVARILVLTLAAVWPARAEDGRPARVEHFDDDPKWNCAGNRIRTTKQRGSRQAFGFHTSNHAGRKPGEIGGVVWRSVEPAYYGKRIDSLTFDNPMSCSGTLSLVHAPGGFSGYQNGSTIFVGFFNHKEQGWRPINFIGFRLEGYNEPDGATIEVSYGTRQWSAHGAFVNRTGQTQARMVKDLDQRQLLRVAPDKSRHAWELRYEPKGGDGFGQITFVFDGVASMLNLSREHRAQGAIIDRCGLFAGSMPGAEMTAYFDDMTINGREEDFSRDPDWDGVGNTASIEDPIGYGESDFGYCRTGDSGEMGGRLWRVQENEFKGYCGDDVGRLTLDDRLVAKGKLRVSRFSVDSGAHFGWFSAKEQGWPPKNFVGVYLDSLTRIGRFVTPMYGTSKPAGVGIAPPRRLFVPDGRTYAWTLEYDPAAHGGNGAVTLTLDGESTTLNLAPGHKAQGAAFDRFGLFNMQDNNGKDCVLYLDDLSYTTAAGDRREVDAR